MRWDGSGRSAVSEHAALSTRPLRKGRIRGHATGGRPRSARFAAASAPGAGVDASSTATLPANAIKSAKLRWSAWGPCTARSAVTVGASPAFAGTVKSTQPSMPHAPPPMAS
jgi:hypothetical protein